ncbi:MAG: epoxide hydrolase, partial [Actinomycetota bacterium]|nr:epoxide hydrolase [Actinomycetota bacterium]
PNALPLIVTHGWPGSVAEFLDVIEPLREDFHVVVPSLPGYGWSGPTTEPGWDVQRVAQAWKTLMARLGYDRYGAQGGDWGAMISARLAAIDPEHMVGLHSNMLLAFPEDASGIELTESEIADLVGVGEFMKTGSAYQEIQGKNPQTLGYGLTDSPAGLAGWIVEKFLVWTDNEGSPEDAVTRDQLLTNVTVYWVTKTINSSVRLYCESQRTDRFGPTGEYITVPTAAAVFPKEMFRIPEAYAKSRFNLVRYNRFDRGGHFAALEEPDLLVQDVREFFHDLASEPS